MQAVAAMWSPAVLTLFNEVMFFSQQSEDNKPADLSCGYKQPCQPTANKLKTFASRQSVRRIVVWSGDEGRSVSVAAVFVYLHGVVGLEFV